MTSLVVDFGTVFFFLLYKFSISCVDYEINVCNVQKHSYWIPNMTAMCACDHVNY